MNMEKYKKEFATQFAKHSEFGARLRGEPEVPREYTLKVLNMIDRGEVECERFASGMPDLKRVHALALALYTQASVKS